MADNNKTLMILTWFSVTISSVMTIAACNVNFVNVYIIAYRVYVYTCIPNTFSKSESRFV